MVPRVGARVFTVKTARDVEAGPKLVASGRAVIVEAPELSLPSSAPHKEAGDTHQRYERDFEYR